MTAQSSAISPANLLREHCPITQVIKEDADQYQPLAQTTCYLQLGFVPLCTRSVFMTY